MKPHLPAILFPLITSFFLLPAVGKAQATPPHTAPTLQVVGHSGTIPITQFNGKSYVEIDSLSHLIGGTVLHQSNRITMTLPAPRLAASPPTESVAAATAPPVQPSEPHSGFSPNFLRAGIESMAAIREWRIAIVNAVQTGNPVTEDWVGAYRRTADTARAFAATTATSDSDRKAVPLLQNEFNHMQQLSESFIALRRNLSYVDPNSFDNNPLDQKILACARGLSSLAASGQFEDVPSCH
jgi:hypothetical protein